MQTLFVYGSILNSSFVPTGTILAYTTLVPNSDFSVRRSFCAHRTWMNPTTMTNIQYTAVGLEVVPLSDARPVNGLLLEVSDEKLEGLIARESNYTLTIVPSSIFQERFTASPIYTFVVHTPEPPSEEFPLNLNYIGHCIAGFSKAGKEFAREFIKTTFHWTSEGLAHAENVVNKS